MDPAQQLAPADLRYKIVKNVAALAQLDDGRLPDGARIIVQDVDSGAGASNNSGMREFIFTRRPLTAALTFSEVNGALSTATRNAYQSKSGYLYVQYPQQYLIQLNAATPVVVADAVTTVGGAAVALSRLLFRRTSVPTAAGTPLFTLGDSTFSVVSQANDDGQILVSLWASFLYP